MRVIKTFLLLMVCISFAVAMLVPSRVIRGASPEARGAIYDLPSNSWQIPFKPDNEDNPSQQTNKNFYEFAWQSFVALNWPSLGTERGAPDTNKMIGDKGADGEFLPVVWSTYKDPTGEDFLENAQPPADWNATPPPPPSYCDNPHSGVRMLRLAAKDQPGVLSDVSQAGFPQSKARKLRGPVA